jgi:hypothetical protein
MEPHWPTSLYPAKHMSVPRAQANHPKSPAKGTLVLLTSMETLTNSQDHRVCRGLSFFSSRRNWDSPNPSPAGECAPPLFGSRGRCTLAGERGEEVGKSQFQGTCTVVLFIYMCTLCSRLFRSSISICVPDILLCHWSTLPVYIHVISGFLNSPRITGGFRNSL